MIAYLIFDIVDLSAKVLDYHGLGNQDNRRIEKILKMSIIVFCQIGHCMLMTLSSGFINFETSINIYIFIRVVAYLLYFSYNVIFIFIVLMRAHIRHWNMLLDGLNSNLNTKEINNLEKVIYNDNIIKNNGEKVKYDTSSCIICIDNFTKGDSIIVLPCDHCYHEECIRKWLSFKGICPTCKLDISGYPEITSASGMETISIHMQ